MLLVEFINVVAKNMESYRAETEKGITQFLDHLWTKFDADKNGFIDASETKQMITQITHKDTDVDVEDVNNFIKNINGGKGETITKPKLRAFVISGILMTREEREDYRSRGKLHGTIISFFDGIDEQRAVFKENQNKKALQTTPTPDIDKKQDDGDDSEKANIQEFLEHIWELYDVDKNGFVDAEEASYMLEDLSGLKSINTVDKDNFFKALNNGKIGQVTLPQIL